MKRTFPWIFLGFLMLSGCSGAPFQLALLRMGATSGIEEHYLVRSDDSLFKLAKLPGSDLMVTKRGVISKTLVDSLGNYLHANSGTLDSIHLAENADFRTTLEVKIAGRKQDITWVGLDPPIGQNPVLDSLYRKMLQIEARISQFQDYREHP